jgi:GntR family transcriptional regulator/MocR family aminotransferase
MRIPLDRTKPLARQIQHHLKRLIREEHLAPGVKLPATRELAGDLGVNRATVTTAYEGLVAEGLARARVGQGTFVAAPARHPAPPTPNPQPQAGLDWSGLFSKASHLIAADTRRRQGAGQIGRATPGLISFADGMPDATLFPTEAFRQVLNRVVKREGPTLLQYSPVGGHPPLRRFLADYLLRQGIEARPEEILIVNGSQQGLDLVARTLLDPGDFVAIEQPTYPQAIQIFRSLGAQLLPVPMGPAGLSLDHLERLLERHTPKLLYCQPNAQNPTGLTLDTVSRRTLLALAGRHRLPIVEDGFDAGLYYGDPPAAPLAAGDHQGLVIFIGTFSKVLFPGLRLGWIVAPRPLLERLEAAKQLSDIHTSPLIQAAIFHFCQGRFLGRHLARLREEYGRRRRLLLSALERHLPKSVRWSVPQGGFTLLCWLPEPLDAVELLRRGLGSGVAFTPGSVFYVDDEGDRALRLSFSSVSAARVEEGVRRLGELIREALRRPPRPLPVERAAVPLV